MKIQLFSGQHRIIASGETYLFNDSDDLMIDITDDDGAPISIVLRFIDRPGQMDISNEIIDDSMIINCYNFNSKGAGLKHPCHIADIDGRPLYFIFATELLSMAEDKMRTVKYTLFTSK